MGIADQLQINVGSQGLKPPADDGRRAEIGHRTEERQQQNRKDGRPEQWKDHIPQNGSRPCAHIPGGAQHALIQLLQDFPKKDGVQRHKGQRLHPDHTPEVIGVAAQPQQPVGDPAPATIKLNIGQRGHEGRRHHGYQQQCRQQALHPAPGSRQRKGCRHRQGSTQQRRQCAGKQTVAQTAAIQLPHLAVMCRGDAARAVAERAGKETDHGPQNEQAKAAQQPDRQQQVSQPPCREPGNRLYPHSVRAFSPIRVSNRARISSRRAPKSARSSSSSVSLS